MAIDLLLRLLLILSSSFAGTFGLDKLVVERRVQQHKSFEIKESILSG